MKMSRCQIESHRYSECGSLDGADAGCVKMEYNWPTQLRAAADSGSLHPTESQHTEANEQSPRVSIVGQGSDVRYQGPRVDVG